MSEPNGKIVDAIVTSDAIGILTGRIVDFAFDQQNVYSQKVFANALVNASTALIAHVVEGCGGCYELAADAVQKLVKQELGGQLRTKNE